MSPFVRMIGWCNRDECYERVDTEFRKLTMGDSLEDIRNPEYVSSVDEIKDLIESGDIEPWFIEKIIVEDGIMQNIGDEFDSIIDVLDAIAELFDWSGPDRKSICCFVWKDLGKAGAIEERGYSTIG